MIEDCPYFNENREVCDNGECNSCEYCGLEYKEDIGKAIEFIKEETK